MEFDNFKRASSAGYRLPERSKGIEPITKQPCSATSQPKSGNATVAPTTRDAVKKDQAWKEMVWSERRAVQDWDRNWSFLRNYDQLGELKSDEPERDNSLHLLGCSPNTTNQTFGSRLSTPMGRELIRLDKLLLCSMNFSKCKQDPELMS
ncbi:ciliary microtubule inner protein 5 [Stigmatopora nigra]